MKTAKRAILLVSAAAMVAGCSTTELPQLPADDVPVDWTLDAAAAERAWPESDWWTGFGNPELSGYIDQVQERNLDLQINRRNLESAQINLESAGFQLLPIPALEIGGNPSWRDARIDGESLSSTSNSPLGLAASLSYNDILSRPAIYDRALAGYDSTVAQSADVALNTLATAASSYFQLLLTRDKITSTLQNVENAEAIYAIAQARVEAGVAIPLEALQQQIALERERLNLQSFRQDEFAVRSSLALLTGQSVQDFDLQGQSLDEVAVPAVMPGLPSELLIRRPDLVQAEAGLRSTRASVDLVRTALFPQISLNAGNTTSSSSLADLLTSPDSMLTANASLVQLLLDNGQRGRDIDQAELELENSLSNYRRTVIAAFNEVDVLLNNLQLLDAQTGVALQNQLAAEESFRIAQLRYEEGVADFQTVLTAQDALFDTRNAYLDRKQAQLNATVALFQALGGGWQMPD